MAGDPAASECGVAGPRHDPTGMFMPRTVALMRRYLTSLAKAA